MKFKLFAVIILALSSLSAVALTKTDCCTPGATCCPGACCGSSCCQPGASCCPGDCCAKK